MSILVAGLAKTGTTGVLYLIANSVVDPKLIFEPPAAVVAGLSGNDKADRLTIAKVVYSNVDQRSLAEMLDEFDSFDRKVWIARDPRDQLVSAFLYTWYFRHKMPKSSFEVAVDLVERKESGERISFKHILASSLGLEGYYHSPDFYSDRVCDAFRSGERDFFIYPYEDLIHNRSSELSRYLGLEITGDSSVPDELSRVVRTKWSGNWRNWFEPEDVDYFRPILSEYMQLMDIEDDWSLSDIPIDPELNSRYMRYLFSGGCDESE